MEVPAGGPAYVPGLHNDPPWLPRGPTAVRCPDCRALFPGRPAPNELVRCPRCGNEGYLAPGNCPQLTDAQVDSLNDAQFVAYLRNGFEILVPVRSSSRPWGRASPAVGQLAARAALALALAWVALIALGPLAISLDAATKLLAMVALLVMSMLAVALGHWAYHQRSGRQWQVAVALAVAWLSVLPAGALAQEAYAERECLSSFSGAVWTERGAADALRAQGVDPPPGNPDLPSPRDKAPPVSALTRVGHAGTWAHYQAFFENATHARITVQKVVNASFAEEELRGFLANLTGRPQAAMADLANAIMTAASDHDGMPRLVISEDGVITPISPSEPLLPGPFDLPALYARTEGKPPWGFDWAWAKRTLPLLDEERHTVGRIHYTAMGMVRVESDDMPVPQMQAFVARAFNEARLPAPTFDGFHAQPAAWCR